ncbi:MAG: hypothetical protein KJO34_04785 [Deltaproteobacteria bacterium]|nr:hypothetical protein [Deltaproteobacteria bacterium]
MRKNELGGNEHISIGGPFRIKVPKASSDDQPYIGFSSQELGEAYLKIKNFPADDFYIVPIETLLDEEQRKHPILIYENEKQIHDVEKDSEGYDYESLIHQNAL